MMAPGSLAQLIQHSTDHRAWYREAGEASETSPVTTTFHNMRGAKHRFESKSTPLNRICLNWEADLAFLERLTIERRNS